MRSALETSYLRDEGRRSVKIGNRDLGTTPRSLFLTDDDAG